MHTIEIVCLKLVYISVGNEGPLVVQMGESQLVKIVNMDMGRHDETRLIEKCPSRQEMQIQQMLCHMLAIK